METNARLVPADLSSPKLNDWMTRKYPVGSTVDFVYPLGHHVVRTGRIVCHATAGFGRLILALEDGSRMRVYPHNINRVHPS